MKVVFVFRMSYPLMDTLNSAMFRLSLDELGQNTLKHRQGELDREQLCREEL